MEKSVVDLDLSLVEGTLSWWLLRFVASFDSLGARTWNLALVGICTALFLLGTRYFFAKKRGVDWLALIHAIVSGYGSFVAVYLSVFASEALTGESEPHRSIVCAGALTSFHRFIPAITMGYGLFDVIEGLSHGIDFLAHGLATFTIMAYFVCLDVGEIIVPMLLMEISTVHLASVRADFFSELGTTLNMACFVLTFFFFRIVCCPYLWYGIMVEVMKHKDTEAYQACLPGHFHVIVFLFGMFFHCLNSFWFYKIILKVRRKLSGEEKIKEGNNLEDAGEKLTTMKKKQT